MAGQQSGQIQDLYRAYRTPGQWVKACLHHGMAIGRECDAICLLLGPRPGDWGAVQGQTVQGAQAGDCTGQPCAIKLRQATEEAAKVFCGHAGLEAGQEGLSDGGLGRPGLLLVMPRTATGRRPPLSCTNQLSSAERNRCHLPLCYKLSRHSNQVQIRSSLEHAL